MLKVTFVYPDFESLGVEYLMARCIQAGHSTDLVFYNSTDQYLELTVRDVRYERIAKDIMKTSPEVVAFSCVSDNFQHQLKCAKMLKGMSPTTFIMFGGVHPTSVPQKVLKNPEVDGVAIGESERSFIEFLDACDGGDRFVLTDKRIDGIVYKRDWGNIGNFRESQLMDIEKIPFPHKRPFTDVLMDARYEYRTITSRGCPYGCSYCFNNFYHRLRGNACVRRRSVSNVLEELKQAKELQRPRLIIFLDDCFTLDAGWTSEFCKRYKKNIALPFACITHPECTSRKLATELADAGCVNVQLGIQSLSAELSKTVLKRRIDRQRIADAIDDFTAVGIAVQVDHMLGIPGDTMELELESIMFYNRHRPSLITVFWLTYYPKTDIVDLALKGGILAKKDVDAIEEGYRPSGRNYLTGGDMKNPDEFYSIAFLLNYLPMLPGILVTFLVRTGFYRMFKFRNYFLAVALPRAMYSMTHPKDYRGRSHIIRFYQKTLGAIARRYA